MVDTVTSKVIENGDRNYIVRLTNISDGTGESAVIKINVSDLSNSGGETCTHLRLDRVDYDIQGFTDVRLLFDATSDDVACILSAGQGSIDWSAAGGNVDPQSTGSTGDLKLTTTGAVSGDTYDITLYCIKRYG